jgi:hypothetical protein
MKTCQPSSARANPLAIATTTLNRTVVVTSSPLDACTMKVTATPYLFAQCATSRSSKFCSSLGTINATGLQSSTVVACQKEDFETASKDMPFKKSSKACFPANCAAR